MDIHFRAADTLNSTPVSAANPLPVTLDTGAGLAPKGYQQLTGMTTATALTVPTGATMAVVTAEAQGVRWRDDGTNPTATVGIPIAAAAAPQTFNGAAELAALKFIQQTSGAILNVAYYG